MASLAEGQDTESMFPRIAQKMMVSNSMTFADRTLLKSWTENDVVLNSAVHSLTATEFLSILVISVLSGVFLSLLSVSVSGTTCLTALTSAIESPVFSHPNCGIRFGSISAAPSLLAFLSLWSGCVFLMCPTTVFFPLFSLKITPHPGSMSFLGLWRLSVPSVDLTAHLLSTFRLLVRMASSVMARLTPTAKSVLVCAILPEFSKWFFLFAGGASLSKMIVRHGFWSYQESCSEPRWGHEPLCGSAYSIQESTISQVFLRKIP
jgi:hypothetical protein